ncbi:MAG: hypothetical protein WAL32_05095, partial [Terriglobales bacterium]
MIAAATAATGLAEYLFVLTTTNSTGMTTSVKNIDPSSPKAITLANGDHMLEREMIIGVTPTAAAMVVRKIGRSLRSP